MKSTIVIGHKNPDTDSICSAICYAHFKSRLTGEEYIPCRAGELNNETQFVLDHFGVEPPKLIQSLEPRIADVQYRQVEGISPGISLRRAWGHMRDTNIQTLPVVTKRGKIKGIITLGDEARFYLEDQDPRALSKANTPYQNIASTLWGEILVGDPEGRFMKGKVVIAAAHPSVMEDYIEQGDLVLLGSNTDVQRYAIDHGAGCIVICVGSKVTPNIRMRAQEAGCTVIVSPMDMYACAKLIIQAMPVSHVMRKDEIITFNLDDLVTEVKATVSKLRIRYFPVLDNGGNYVGMISQRNLLDIDKQRVILVDHNERGQAVDGLRGAEVVEIIDHHRIDAVETINPIYFRAQPLGCTSTIVSMMFRENHIEIEPTIAGLMCSAIISDTLMFRSPTCTPADEAAARMLASIAGINIEEYAIAMFNAGSKLGEKTPDEIFHLDCKKFKATSASIYVAQITSVSAKELERVRERLIPYMEGLLPQSGAEMLFLMLTNIIEESTCLVFVGKGAKGVVRSAFDEIGDLKNNSALLPGVVSRKKQIVGPLITAIDEM